MKKVMIFCAALLLAQCTPSAKDELGTLITDYQSFKAFDYDEFPLGDYSEQRFEKQYSFYQDCFDRAQKINTSELSDDELRSLHLLRFVLEHRIKSHEFKMHYNPILSDAGFHNSLIYRVRKVVDKKGALRYLRLLKSIPQYIEQNTALIRKGIEMGISQPRVIFNGYENSYEQHITEDASSNYYYEPFLNLPDQLSTQEKDSLQNAAKEVIEEQLIPTFVSIKNFFETEYYPKTRTAIGVSETPDGMEFYNNRIAYYTTLDLTAEEVHQMGLDEVQRIRSEMQKIIAELEFKGSFAEFLVFLRTDEQFYANSPKELLMFARDVAKRLDEQLPRYFKTLPRKPYGVAPVPDAIAPKYTGGRYIGTAPNSTEPGYYWVNTYNLPSRPLYTIPALTAHEAVPGHHLQGALNAELPEHIPQFRRNLYLSAYGEGWGLYTESLAEEMGIYTTPYERFGQLTYSMWRACRLVVDTGMHAFGWSREEAVKYMAENTALSLHEVNTEIDRYISWPGQALAYKVGELKIRELRQKAEEALGDSFDIRAFHEVILANGTLTLPMLESEINDFIASYSSS
ncbi:MAG: DUF885 domain-containing protein [Flavobacteriaceae bacterium]|nr:DUF885 domain-containing protein [Flavobacteriaceae bacterium]